MNKLEFFLKHIESDIKLYAIFDAALVDDLWINIDIWNLESTPLYKGNSDSIAKAIPYLIEFDITKDKDACISLFETLGSHTVFLLQSSLPMQLLLEKFQSFYHILIDQTSMLRRFYDPRVFHSFLTKMDNEHRQIFIEGIEKFWVEETSNTMNLYINQGSQLKIQKISLKGINA